MAEFDVYGPEASPFRLAARDQQEAAQRRAQTRLLDANASKVEEELAGQKRLSAAMAEAAKNAPPDSVGAGATPSLANPIEAAARAAYAAGLPAEGVKFAEGAALVRTREATQATADAQRQAAVLKLKLERIDTIGRLAGSAKDQGSLDAANANYAKMFGEVSPFAGLSYEEAAPRLQAAREWSLTEKQKMELAIKQSEADSKDRNRASAIDYRGFREEILQQEQDLREAREARLAAKDGKAGVKGAAVGSPTGAEQGEATRLLKEEFPNWPADELKSASYAVASRARGLRRANKALEADEALQQAFEEAKASGAYEVQDSLMGLRKKTHFNREKLQQVPLTGAGTAGVKPAANGLPSGSKQIGTSKGKPVYETPDGKRFIAE